MKRLLCFLSTGLFLANFAEALDVGDGEAAVRSALGNPAAWRKISADEQIWKFRDGTTVWFSKGAVEKIAGPASGNSMRRSGATAWERLPAIQPASPKVDVAPPPQTDVPATFDVRSFRPVILAAGVVAILGLLRFGFRAGEWFGRWTLVPLLGRAVAFFLDAWFGMKRVWRPERSNNAIQALDRSVVVLQRSRDGALFP